VRGDKDDAAYSALTEKISRGIPQAETVVIAGGTHFLHLEKPTEFQRLVNNFLKR
jgi:pimeloyl-ACP methyl ester carboxylesterase